MAGVGKVCLTMQTRIAEMKLEAVPLLEFGLKSTDEMRLSHSLLIGWNEMVA